MSLCCGVRNQHAFCCELDAGHAGPHEACGQTWTDAEVCEHDRPRLHPPVFQPWTSVIDPRTIPDQVIHSEHGRRRNAKRKVFRGGRPRKVAPKAVGMVKTGTVSGNEAEDVKAPRQRERLNYPAPASTEPTTPAAPAIESVMCEACHSSLRQIGWECPNCGCMPDEEVSRYLSR